MAVILMVSGVSSAHAAFGEIMKCPSGMIMATNMADCCDHGAKDTTKSSCGKCDFCCAVTIAIAPAKLSGIPEVVDGFELSVRHTVEKSAVYLPLRPPNDLI